MNNPKILIIGDSFAADWTVKYKNKQGWPNLLADKYPVVNLAQAGVGEYKIYNQLRSVLNLHEFDIVIVSHTSPYRVHTRRHPVHNEDPLHKNADLMMTDILYHNSQLKNIFNRELGAANKFFKYHFDPDYFETTYRLLRNQIHEILKNKKVILISNLPGPAEYSNGEKLLDFSNLVKLHSGTMNHLDNDGNEIIYQSITKEIESIYTTEE